MRLFKVCLAFVFCVSTTFADQLQGCSLDSTICDENEICLNDGLFGQCYSEGSGNTPLVIQKPLTAVQQNVLRFHLYQLAREDVNWPDASSQCVLSYFKLAVVYDLDYDVDFCKVRNPANVWALVQRVQAMLADSDGYLSDEELQTGQTQARSLTEEQLAALEGSEQAAEQAQISEPILETSALSPVEEVEAVEQEPLLKVAQQVLFVDPEDNVALPVVFLKDVSPEELMQELAAEEEETGEPVSVVIEADEHPSVNATNNNIAPADASDINEDQVAEIVDELAKEAQQEPKKRDLGSALELTNDEKNQLDDYVHDVLNTGNVGSKKLSPVQQNKIVELIGSLQQVLEQSQDISAPEIEEIVPLTSLNNEQQLLLKKDIEQYNNADMGLANVVHKIVKGDFHRLEGNRVYLRVAKEDITDEDLDKLIEFLDRKIAQPNDLYFDDFKYEDGQLSFRIVRLNDIKPSGDKRMDSASGVAQAVYKRRKDIQTLAGLQVDETGIGSGQETVPVEKSERDWMFMPILFVCSLTIMTLLSVLAANFYKNRKTPLNVALPQVFDQFDSKAASTYEDLCRQRMNTQDVAGTSGVNNNGGSKTSSTSSWPDDGFMQTCNLDVSTGHVILSFLKEHLENPGKIVDQWLSVSGYFNANAVTTIAQEPQNVHKNRDQSLIPYDESLAGIANGYINASKIHDSDPRHCAYILTQTPMEATIADYWQLVWEHGVSLLVNLCQLNEGERYWPSEGTEVYGSFEVNLVSEHIWSEDYVVRSFYLKLLKTGETRTVTQFHYLSWPKGSVPESNKSLLEFRRKVNKSYRGRSSPILVHDLDGTGRAGTYCLIDVVTNRINKGVKEIDIAASLEHIRDQRPYLVANSEQYNLVFSCVAEEVTSLIKAIQH